MLKEELIKVYLYTKSIFANFNIPTDKLQLESQNLVWFKYLKDYELDIIYTSIDLYARNNQFVNISQIAEICERTKQISNGNVKDAYYYLNEISKAVSYSNAKENFEKLSNFSKQIVVSSAKLAQWSNAGETFNTIIANSLLKQINKKLEEDTTKKLLEKNNQMLIESNQKRIKTIKQE